MVMRISPQILARILNDEVGPLQAVGEVSPFLPALTRRSSSCQFRREFFKAPRKGLGQVTDVFPE